MKSDKPKLTQAEAEEMLQMLKRAMIDVINAPEGGNSLTFDAEGVTKKGRFIIGIYRGKIDAGKCNYSARIKINGIPLLELHVGAKNMHFNKDESTPITGSHWHIYTEKDPRYAYPADDVTSDSFVENTVLFLRKFNIIDPLPEIYDQGRIGGL